MTEDDAKTKWCPFARVAVAIEDNQRHDWIGVAGANRGALHPKINVPDVEDRLNPPSAHCIASACMAWRWAPEVRGYSQEVRPGEPQGPLEPTYTGLLSKTDGRCGLAG